MNNKLKRKTNKRKKSAKMLKKMQICVHNALQHDTSSIS